MAGILVDTNVHYLVGDFKARNGHLGKTVLWRGASGMRAAKGGFFRFRRVESLAFRFVAHDAEYWQGRWRLDELEGLRRFDKGGNSGG